MFRWPPLDVSASGGLRGGGGGEELGPQVNKFELVSNDDHQMSVAGRGVTKNNPGDILGKIVN